MNKYLQSLAMVSFAVICSIVLQGCGQENYWERTLSGPFEGEPFRGELTTPATSSTQLSSNWTLDVHQDGSTNHPIIRIRDLEGRSAWAHSLVPRREGEEMAQGRILTMTLQEVRRTPNGFKVFFLCDWTRGGKERGIIYLDTNYVFRSFAVGW